MNFNVHMGNSGQDFYFTSEHYFYNYPSPKKHQEMNQPQKFCNNQRKKEQNFQKFFWNRLRFNEIDPRFVTQAFEKKYGVIKFPYRLARTIAYESLYEVWRLNALSYLPTTSSPLSISIKLSLSFL